MSLRQQARAGTVYAPGLNYAPIPMPASPFKASAAAVLEEQRIKTINGVQVFYKLGLQRKMPPPGTARLPCGTMIVFSVILTAPKTINQLSSTSACS